MQEWQPRRGRSRRYRYSRRHARRLRWDRVLIALAVLAGVAVLLIGLVKLIGYGVDLIASRNTASKLQTIYYAEPTDEPNLVTEAPTQTPAPTPEETPAPTPGATVSSTPLPTPTPVPRLPSVSYPDNPKLTISSQFKALRKESKYIVGWLTIHRMLDEAVVQRDNVYYLDHDAMGGKNVNGALFLDSIIDLKTRPYCYIIYGHNMKTGVMFGSLRNYENRTYYHNDPFISFDTMYESGRYVIFAVGTISTVERNPNYVDFYALSSDRILERQAAIDALIAASVYTCPLDVRTDDQLLMLVTCVEKDEERRVVVARRIREGENETELKRIIEKSRKR